MNKLLAGCGIFKKKGYINLDYNKAVRPDILHDLNKYPYPFKNNTFDLIEIHHVLEHLEDAFMAMKELSRITKKDGIIHITVPHYSLGFAHPGHKNGFGHRFPNYFIEEVPEAYMGTKLECTFMELHWLGQKYLKKRTLNVLEYNLAMIANAIINLFAKLDIPLASRLWCYWVGGFEEIEFKFKVE